MRFLGRIGVAFAAVGMVSSAFSANLWSGTVHDGYSDCVRALMLGNPVPGLEDVDVGRRPALDSLGRALAGSTGYGVVVPSVDETGMLGKYGVPTTTERCGRIALADLGDFVRPDGVHDAEGKRALLKKIEEIAGGAFELTVMNDQAVTTLARVAADGKSAVVAAFNPGPDSFHDLSIILRHRPAHVEVLQPDGTWLEHAVFFEKGGVLLLSSHTQPGDVFVVRVTFGAPVRLPVFSGKDSDRIDETIARACADGSRKATIFRKPDGTPWYITRAILLPDDFTLEIDDCIVQSAPGTRDNLIRNAGAVGRRKVTPNRNITIRGKGKAVLCGGLGNHYEPNRSGDCNGWRTIGILFAHVTGFSVENITLRETQAWGMSFEYCSNGRITGTCLEDTNLMYNQDGIDLRVGCHDIVIDGVSGTCGDDAVALTGCGGVGRSTVQAVKSGWANSGDGGEGMEISREPRLATDEESIHDVAIRNVRARSTGGHSVVRLLPNDGVKMYNISVSNVVDTTLPHQIKAAGTIRIGDTNYTSVRPAQIGDMHHITVENVEAKGKVGVWIKCPLVDSTIRNVTVPAKTQKYDVKASLLNVTLN